MSKVLILTYYWPPAGGPGVQRWLYFSRYLRNYGIEPVLYVPEDPHYPVRDPELKALVPDSLTVYRSRFWEPYKIASLFGKRRTRRISSGIIKRENPGLVERVLLWIRGNLFIPDARKYWRGTALKELPEILEREGISTLITTGPPHSVHLVGLDMKQKYGLQWIADFRDPWTEIGYQDALRLTKRAQQRHREMERSVLTGADTVIATSTITAEAFTQVANRPVTVITNGYDGQPADGSQPPGDFKVSHVGSMLSGRNPHALWKAFSELRREHPAFREAFRLQLTGLVSPEVKASLQKWGLWEATEVQGYVSHEEAVARQREAQVLLLIEIDREDTRGIVPGKLFEYMAAARPILAVGPKGWEAARRLEESRCGHGFAYDEDGRIKAQIYDWFRAYGDNRLNWDASGSLPYRREALTGKLAETIRNTS